jgi:hypothetical protein
MTQSNATVESPPAASPPKDKARHFKHRWLSEVMMSSLDLDVKGMLGTIAEKIMHPDGMNVWASQATIGEWCGRSRQSVNRMIGVAQTAGLVRYEMRPDERGVERLHLVPTLPEAVPARQGGVKESRQGGVKESRHEPTVVNPRELNPVSTATGVERPRRGATAVPELDSPMLIAAVGERHAGPDPLRDLILERRLDADEEMLCGLAEKAVDSLRVEPESPDAGTRLLAVVDAVLAVDAGCELRMTAEQVSEVVEKFSREVVAHRTDELAAIAVAAEDRRPTRVGPHRVNFTLGRLRDILWQMKAAA